MARAIIKWHKDYRTKKRICLHSNNYNNMRKTAGVRTQAANYTHKAKGAGVKRHYFPI